MWGKGKAGSHPFPDTLQVVMGFIIKKRNGCLTGCNCLVKEKLGNQPPNNSHKSEIEKSIKKS